MLERGVATVVDMNNAGLFLKDMRTEICPIVPFAGVGRANTLVLSLDQRLDLHVKH